MEAPGDSPAAFGSALCGRFNDREKSSWATHRSRNGQCSVKERGLLIASVITESSFSHCKLCFPHLPPSFSSVLFFVLRSLSVTESQTGINFVFLLFCLPLAMLSSSFLPSPLS